MRHGAGAPAAPRMTAMTADPSRADDDERAIAEVEQQFGRLFHRVRANWKRFAATVHPDLQPMGYKVLSTIVSRGSAKAGDLVEELHTDKSVMSRQVRQLEALGLVEARVDERDARARVLVATPIAIDRVNAVRAQNQAEMRARLSTWTRDEIATFAELLSRLAD